MLRNNFLMLFYVDSLLNNKSSAPILIVKEVFCNLVDQRPKLLVELVR